MPNDNPTPPPRAESDAEKLEEWLAGWRHARAIAKASGITAHYTDEIVDRFLRLLSEHDAALVERGATIDAQNREMMRLTIELLEASQIIAHLRAPSADADAPMAARSILDEAVDHFGRPSRTLQTKAIAAALVAERRAAEARAVQRIKNFAYGAEGAGQKERAQTARDIIKMLGMAETVFDAPVAGSSPAGREVPPMAPTYVASRASIPERSAMWRSLRAEGWPITSTWIDEAGEGETADFAELWDRIVREIAAAGKLVLYAEQEDFPLKGALIEAGIAIGMGKPVVVCLPGVDLNSRTSAPVGSWIAHRAVTRIDQITEAMSYRDGYTAAGARATLFVDGEFTAHSGDTLPFKIDCDALTDTDLATLAADVSRRFPRFRSVKGVPRGGVRFAGALRRYATGSQLDPALIVDDVLTTGASMEQAREGVGRDVFGIVIFARGPCPDWITPLLTTAAATGGPSG